MNKGIGPNYLDKFLDYVFTQIGTWTPTTHGNLEVMAQDFYELQVKESEAHLKTHCFECGKLYPTMYTEKGGKQTCGGHW